MNYKYRLVENEDEGSFSRIKAEPKVTLITPNVNAALAALGDIKNYGEYAVTNARQDSNVEKNIEQNFGPKNPKIKTEQEKLFATKSKEEWINYFAEKQRKANLGKKTESKEIIINDLEKKYDTLTNNNGKYLVKTGGEKGSLTKTTTNNSKPTLLPKPKIEGNKIIFYPRDENDRIKLMLKYIETIMTNAGIEDFELEDNESELKKLKKSKKPTKKSQLKEIIKSEIRSLLK
jgi:hypothetical protein